MFDTAENEINFDSFIKFPLFSFKLVFFDFEPLPAHPTFRDLMKNYAKINCCRLFIASYVLAVISLGLYSFLIAEDFLTAIINIPNVVIASLVALKVLVTLQHRSNIWNIFEDLRTFFKAHEGDNAKYNIKKYLDSYHSLFRADAIVITFIFLSVVSQTLPYLIFGTMELPVNYWFPFDPYKPRNFPIALGWTDFCAYSFLTFLLSADTLLYALAAVVAMEFNVLKADFLEIKSTPKCDRMATLISLVDRHNRLFEITDQLQKIYEVTFFVCFVISSLAMCFVAFILSNANDFFLYSFFVPLLLLVVGQIFLLCHFGQEIFDSSAAIADGIFNSNWEDFDDVAVTRLLILVIARAQRSKKLSAMGFCDLTLNNFASVSLTSFTFAYSLLTLVPRF